MERMYHNLDQFFYCLRVRDFVNFPFNNVNKVLVNTSLYMCMVLLTFRFPLDGSCGS
jgi:hypothetical protein